MTLAKVLGTIGRVLITAGVLILLFVSYQLWGTGIREAQAQNRLESQFEDVIGDLPDVEDLAGEVAAGSGDPEAATPTPDAGPPPPPVEGDAVARMAIPSIDVDKIVVEGVQVDDLKKGPGHYPSSPLPGQPGNAAIAGHRTTYGAPFHDIDKLEPGDVIYVTTRQGSFRYEMTEQHIVSPSQVEVLEDFGDNRLTLTACHPKYSAAQRIVVVATLVGEAAPGLPAGERSGNGADDTIEAGSESEGEGGAAPGENSSQTIDAGLSGEGASAWPAILMAAACALIWIAAWLLGLIWKKWPAYLVCLPLFLVMLFFFFENFSRLLPANY
jgi:sortase A